MSQSETRAQRDCSLASLLGPLNLAGETMGNRNSVMRIRVLLVQLHSCESGCHAFIGCSLDLLGPATRYQTGIDAGQPDVPVDALWCRCYSLQKQISSPDVALRPNLVKFPHASTHEVPSRGISVRLTGGSLAFGLQQLRLDGSCNLLCDFVLQRENVAKVALVSLSPERSACRGVNELHRNPHSLATSANAPCQDVNDAKLMGDLSGVEGTTFEGKGRIAIASWR